MLFSAWRLQLFGGLVAEQGERRITRFPTTKTAALLAYLALFPRRTHPREELADLLWPEAELDAARTNLRQSLAALRRLLEPPGTPAGSVLVTDRFAVRLNPATVETDVARFEAALAHAARAIVPEERLEFLQSALDAYAGDLLPGFYDDWVIAERSRLALACEDAAARRQALSCTVAVGAIPAPASGEESAAPLSVSPPAVPPDRGPDARLPMQFTRFFGREEERARVLRLIGDPAVRLVTLTGVGGAGKTRLSVECARQAGGLFAMLSFVPLADLSDASLIADAVLGALGPTRSVNSPPLEQIVTLLACRPALLLLDNLEQFGERAAPVVLALLSRLPALKILATSRHRLHVAGERELHLPPLPTPEADEGALTPERLLGFPGVALFVDRAQLARSDFQITPRNAPAVAALSRRLEGIPLALELAAAWAQTLTPAQMLGRLSERLDALLVSRRKDVDERHQTLRAAIGWSYGLLPPDLPRFWSRLAVFRGGWTVEAAADVCEEPRASDALAHLRSRSLVIVEEAGDALRYRMLEPLREFAWEQLDEAAQKELARRHAEYFLRLAQTAAPHLLGPEQADWLSRLASEHENFRTALAWSLTNAPETALRLSVALIRYWELHSHLREGREWHERAAGAVGDQNRTTERARALNAAGALAFEQADYAAAEAHYRESLSIWQEIGEQRGVAASLNNLGNVESSREEYGAARGYYERALAANRAQGNQAWEAINLNNLGVVAEEQGDYADAQTYGELARALFVSLGNTAGEAMALRNLGVVARRQGDARAADLLRRSLRLDQQLGDKSGQALSLEGLASVAADHGAYGRAARLWSAALAARAAIGFARRPSQADTHESDLARARAAIGERPWNEAWAEGEAMTLEQAVALALRETAESGAQG